MTQLRYAEKVKDIVTSFDPEGGNRYFLFGSSVRKETFHDIDVGVMGNLNSKKDLSMLRDRFYDSDIPYKVDVVDFDTASPDFREHVLGNEPIVWIP